VRPGFARRLVLFAKPPLAGRVKTRLAAGIGEAAAATFFRQSSERLLFRLGRDPRWELILAANAGPGDRWPAWRGVPVIPQGGGDLGARMGRVFASLPPGPALVIGTDSPQIEPCDIEEAFKALGPHEAVFGPAEDGGYWLIGLARRRPLPGLFEGVRWSTAHALADTEASLPEGVKPARLRVLQDVDDAEDLAALSSAYGPLRRGPWRAAARPCAAAAREGNARGSG
jgi:rSAM/selenodomain-associated transferase 1